MRKITSNTKKLKQINVELVKNALISMGGATKLAVANETGLSVATCGNILNELINIGEVIESGSEESSGGRPARLFRYNANHCLVLCLSLKCCFGKFGVEYNIMNLIGKSVERRSLSPKNITLEYIKSLISEALELHPTIQVAAIGVPAVVGSGNGLKLSAIPALNSVSLEDELKERFPKLKFVIENDLNIIALGFYKAHEHDEMRGVSAVVVDFPAESCAGSGIVVDGRVLRGFSNFAGEISYLPFFHSRESISSQVSCEEELITKAADTIISIIAVLNPAQAVLTGDLLKMPMLERIAERVCCAIPADDMPRLIIREDVTEEYMYGLFYAAGERMSCDVMLVKKEL